MSHVVTLPLSALLFMLLAFHPQLRPQLAGQDMAQPTVQQAALKGAWKFVSGNTPFATLPAGASAIAMMEDGYFTVAYFHPTDKKFIGTYGGTYTASNGSLSLTFEYNTLDSATVGTSQALTYSLQNGQLQVAGTGQSDALQQIWAKADQSSTTSPLEGTWRITGRAGKDGTINPMQRGPRKTLKILSGNRFQWIAFNSETKQFSGTGGGTYTAANGKYTEHIDFFSRDPARVGASLSFNYDVQDGKWLHSGKSSTGKDINEVWEREK